MAKVLVVDDDANLGDALAAVIDSAGHGVRVARNGADALHLVAVERPDIVVSDVSMPEMDGLELVRRLQGAAQYKPIPVILMSALHDSPPANAAAFLRKPFPIQCLLDLLARLAPAALVMQQAPAWRSGERSDSPQRAQVGQARLRFAIRIQNERGVLAEHRREALLSTAIALLNEQEQRVGKLRRMGVDTSAAEMLRATLQQSLVELVRHHRAVTSGDFGF
jgi:CheY-like chemotaxis protein